MAGGRLLAAVGMNLPAVRQAVALHPDGKVGMMPRCLPGAGGGPRRREGNWDGKEKGAIPLESPLGVWLPDLGSNQGPTD